MTADGGTREAVLTAPMGQLSDDQVTDNLRHFEKSDLPPDLDARINGAIEEATAISVAEELPEPIAPADPPPRRHIEVLDVAPSITTPETDVDPEVNDVPETEGRKTMHRKIGFMIAAVFIVAVVVGAADRFDWSPFGETQVANNTPDSKTDSQPVAAAPETKPDDGTYTGGGAEPKTVANLGKTVLDLASATKNMADRFDDVVGVVEGMKTDVKMVVDQNSITTETLTSLTGRVSTLEASTAGKVQQEDVDAAAGLAQEALDKVEALEKKVEGLTSPVPTEVPVGDASDDKDFPSSSVEAGAGLKNKVDTHATDGTGDKTGAALDTPTGVTPSADETVVVNFVFVQHPRQRPEPPVEVAEEDTVDDSNLPPEIKVAIADVERVCSQDQLYELRSRGADNSLNWIAHLNDDARQDIIEGCTAKAAPVQVATAEPDYRMPRKTAKHIPGRLTPAEKRRLAGIVARANLR